MKVPDSTSKEIVKLITDHVSVYINKKKGGKPWSTLAGPFDTWVEELGIAGIVEQLGIAGVVEQTAAEKVETDKKDDRTEA